MGIRKRSYDMPTNAIAPAWDETSDIPSWNDTQEDAPKFEETIPHSGPTLAGAPYEASPLISTTPTKPGDIGYGASIIAPAMQRNYEAEQAAANPAQPVAPNDLISPEAARKVPQNLAVSGGGASQPLDTYTKPPEQRLEETKAAAFEPTLKIPQFEINKDDSKLVATGKEVNNLITGIPRFLSSPAGILTLGAGGVFPKTVAAAFTADQAAELGKQVYDAHKNWDYYTPAEKTKAVVDMVGTGLFTGLTAKGAMSGFGTKTEAPKAPATESPEVQSLVDSGAKTLPLSAKAVENIGQPKTPVTTEVSNASTEPISTRLSQPTLRPPVGEGISLQQQGEAAGTQAAPQPALDQSGNQPSGAPASQAPEVLLKPPAPEQTQDWKVTVQSPQLDGKIPGYVQIDDVAGGNNNWSKSKETLAKEGVGVPDFSQLPQGKYTYQQAVDALSKLNRVAEPASTEQPPTGTQPVSQLASVVETPAKESVTQDVTDAQKVQQKYRIGKSPQLVSLVEKLPATDIEIQNGEQPVKIKNDKTGEVQTVMEKDLTPVNERTPGEKTVKTTVEEKLKSLGYSESEISAMPKDGAKALAERGQPKSEPDPHDWTGATDKPKTPQQKAKGIKIKFGNRGNAGFVNLDILNDFVEYGKSIFTKGMDYAKWAAHVVSEFGKSAAKYARAAWDKIVTAYRNSEFSNETGAISLGGRGAVRKRTALDSATSERSTKLQKSFSDAERARKEIKRVAPIEKRQNAISVWLEANGDLATLSAWASGAKGKTFKQAATDAQSLNPNEIDIAKKSQQAFQILEARGNRYDVLGNHRDNYVPHVWNVDKKFSGIGSSKLQDQFKFNKARTFNTFFEGDQSGFVPRTLAIGKLLPAYLHEMNKVIADRQFIESVSDKYAKDGRPLVIPRGRISDVSSDSGGKAYLVNPNATKPKLDAAGNPIEQGDYQVLNGQPALNDWRWEGKDVSGNPFYMKDDLAVHPELAKRLNAMMGKSAIRQWYNEPSSGASVIPKAIAKGLDTAQSVMKREMFSLLAPFHQVQEGTHAIGHLVNPFSGIPDMSQLTPEMTDATNHGLQLLPDRASSQGYLEGVGGSNSFLSQAAKKIGQGAESDTVLGKTSRAAADIVDGYQDYLFHQYIPGLKFKTYQSIQSRNMARFAKELASGEVSESDVKMLSALQTNAAYGHLNLALLDRNPTMQHLMQLGLLAPDFLEARGRFVGQAVKSLVGKKAGNEQFKAIATLALVQAGTAFVLSQLMGDKYDPRHPFEVNRNGRRYALRSIPEDLDRLFLQGPDQRREFISARINPVAQKVDQLRTGLNYRGEKVGTKETLEELMANYIPITARSIPVLRNLTETGKNSPISPLEQLAGSAGLKISRYSPISETYQNASEWKKKAGIKEDTGSYPVSKYLQLRYAIEDGSLDKAQAEFDALKKSGMTGSQISQGFRESLFHPFTGSEKNDREFIKSLDERGKLIHKLAVEKRKNINNAFNSLKH